MYSVGEDIFSKYNLWFCTPHWAWHIFTVTNLTTLHSTFQSSSLSLHKLEQRTTFQIKFWEMLFGNVLFTAKVFGGMW